MLKKILGITLAVLLTGAISYFNLAPGVINKSSKKVIYTASCNG